MLTVQIGDNLPLSTVYSSVLCRPAMISRLINKQKIDQQLIIQVIHCSSNF